VQGRTGTQQALTASSMRFAAERVPRPATYHILRFVSLRLCDSNDSALDTGVAAAAVHLTHRTLPANRLL